MTTTTTHDRGAFAHPALLYHSTREYLDHLVPFIADGLEAGHPVLAAVPGHNFGALRDALGDTAGAITLTDMTQAGRNPGHILGGLLSTFAAKHAPRPVRMIGEPIWPTRSEREYPACVQHEALTNKAFAGSNVTVLCPYDVTALDPDVIADARTTHPVLWQAGKPEQPSSSFAPDAAWARYNRPLQRSPAAITYTARRLSDLRRVRSFTAKFARWFGLRPDGIADLQLIVNELATNSLQHSGGPCALALWRQDGHLVCEARDSGYLHDSLAGRRPIHVDGARGRGLFVVNALADLIRTHTAPGGTTVQAYLRLASA